MGAIGMSLQCLLGLQCRDFVMVAADQTNAQSIVIMKNDEDKIHEISDKLIMGIVGDSGDSVRFAQYVSKHLQLYKMRNVYNLDTSAAVHFTRKSMADGLRSGNPPNIDILIGGYDDIKGGQLFLLDSLGSTVELPFAVQGLGGLICLSLLDRFHKYVTTEADAYELMKLCIEEVQLRLLFNFPNFIVKVVSKTGIKEMPTINAATFL